MAPKDVIVGSAYSFSDSGGDGYTPGEAFSYDWTVTFLVGGYYDVVLSGIDDSASFGSVHASITRVDGKWVPGEAKATIYIGAGQPVAAHWDNAGRYAYSCSISVTLSGGGESSHGGGESSHGGGESSHGGGESSHGGESSLFVASSEVSQASGSLTPSSSLQDSELSSTGSSTSASSSVSGIFSDSSSSSSSLFGSSSSPSSPSSSFSSSSSSALSSSPSSSSSIFGSSSSSSSLFPSSSSSSLWDSSSSSSSSVSSSSGCQCLSKGDGHYSESTLATSGGKLVLNCFGCLELWTECGWGICDIDEWKTSG